MYHLAVKNDKILHSNWIGFGGIYHAFMFQKDDDGREYTKEQCETELARVYNMRLRLARTYYRYEYSHTADGFWDWDSQDMRALSRWCKCLQDHGIDVALQACWWCPNDITNSPFSLGTNDWGEMCRRYGNWVSESVHQIVEVCGNINVKYLMLFTEPGWTSEHLPEGLEQYDAWLDCARAAHNALVRDGRRHLVKLVGPNEGSTDTSDMVKWTAEHANDIIDIYSSHNYIQHTNYDTDTYDEWVDWIKRGMDNCASTGKPYWFDEYGVVCFERDKIELPQQLRWAKGLHAIHIALCNCAAINLGAQTTLIWSLFDQQWPNKHLNNDDCFFDGEHRHGIAPSLRKSAVPYPTYYGVTLLSRYLGGAGTAAYHTEHDRELHIAALQTETGEDVFLIINSGGKPADVTVSCSSEVKRSLYRHLFDSAAVKPNERAEIIRADKILADIGCSFGDTLPPHSFAIYTTEH